MPSDKSQRMPLAGAIATTATMLLVASKLSDILNARFGFDPLSLVFVFPVAAAAAFLVAALTHDILNSRPLEARNMSRTVTTSVLAAFGTVALAIITVAHLHHRPGVDGWIAVAGGLLMLAAAATDHHQRPRAATAPTPPELAALRATAQSTTEPRPSWDQ